MKALTANYDRIHCLAPNLFTSLKKGDYKKEKLDIKYKHGEYLVRFIGFEPLGAFDLRVLQGVVALAKQGEEIEEGDIYNKLELTDYAKGLPSVKVKFFINDFLREIGLKSGGIPIGNVKASLIRLSNVSVILEDTQKQKVGGFNILSFGMDLKGGEISVALNPRLSQGVFGRTSYAKIEMAEVRALKTDVGRLLHSRLCGFIDLGKSLNVGIDKLVSYAYNNDTNSANYRKRKQKVREAILELASLNWKITEYSKDSFKIERPSKSVLINNIATFEIKKEV